MKKSTIDIDAYLETVPEWAQSLLSHLRGVIHKAAPLATEKIAYGMPTFFQKGNLVGFAAHKSHCALYFFTGAFTEEYADWFEGFKITKGGVQFTPENPLPDALVVRIVKARLKEIGS